MCLKTDGPARGPFFIFSSFPFDMILDHRRGRRLQRTTPSESSLEGKVVPAWRGLHQEVESFLFESGRRTGAHGASLTLQVHKPDGALDGGVV